MFRRERNNACLNTMADTWVVCCHGEGEYPMCRCEGKDEVNNS